jgi:hypothetical protein
MKSINARNGLGTWRRLEVGWFLAVKNAIHIAGRAPVLLGAI